MLEQIISEVRADLTLTRQLLPEARLREQAMAQPPARDLAAALIPAPGGRPRVIAELKRASPSKGMIRPDFEVVALAQDLAANGAAALSVLTEPRHFLGRPEYLRAVVANVSIPVLRKDFIVDTYQLYEARTWGADAVLLIAAALPPDQFELLYRTARELGLQVLAEAHDADEVRQVVDAGSEIIGVNSRDLRTFRTDLTATAELLGQIPDGRLRVAESGIQQAHDLARLAEAGAHAFLVGESLMRAPSPGRKLADMLELATRGVPEQACAPGSKSVA